MKVIVGNLRPIKTLMFSVTVIIVTCSCIYFPFSDYPSLGEFYRQNRWAWGWPITVAISIYFIVVSLMLILRLLLFKRTALYNNGREFIFLFPVFFKINNKDISRVISVNKYGYARNIAIVTKNGRKRWIWATFFRESEEDITAKIWQLSNLDREGN